MAFLFNTSVMVIVYTSIKNILFNYQQQGNLTFMLQFTSLSHLFNLCTKGCIFPIFPLLD
jgi:hypothetical protein